MSDATSRAPWWVVVNPAAGHGSDLVERAQAALETEQIPHQLVISRSPEDLAALVRDGRNRGADRFAAVGGDGTAHLLVNAILAEEWADPPTVAILPAGSGSDFIRTFALPKRLEGAVAHLASEDTYPTDVGVLEGSFGRRRFLNVADAGVAAGAAAVASRLPTRLGGLRYTIGFWLTLASHRSVEIDLIMGERRFTGTAINVVFANGQYFGGGMNVAPRASVMDGMLDIQVFSGPRRQAFTVMPRLVRGVHLTHRAVRRFSAGEFTLESEVPLPVEADGEMIGSGSLRGWVEPGAIRFKI